MKAIITNPTSMQK